jgi:hypothetical protein
MPSLRGINLKNFSQAQLKENRLLSSTPARDSHDVKKYPLFIA